VGHVKGCVGEVKVCVRGRGEGMYVGEVKGC